MICIATQILCLYCMNIHALFVNNDNNNTATHFYSFFLIMTKHDNHVVVKQSASISLVLYSYDAMWVCFAHHWTPPVYSTFTRKQTRKIMREIVVPKVKNK